MMPLILPATESYSSYYSPSQICCTLLKLREHTGIIIMMHSILNFEIASVRLGWKKSTLLLLLSYTTNLIKYLLTNFDFSMLFCYLLSSI